MASKKKQRPASREDARAERRQRGGKGFHRGEGLTVPSAAAVGAKAARGRQRLTGKQEDALRLRLGVRMRSEDGHAVHLRVRFIKCGKAGCSSCPHGLYGYERWRGDDGQTHERYLGRAELE